MVTKEQPGKVPQPSRADAITHHLHIGLGKTGTTSIQAMLKSNAGELARRGVLYPGLLFELLDDVNASERVLEFQRLPEGDKVPWLAAYIDRVNGICRQRQSTQVVWSWESMVGMGPTVRAAFEAVPDATPKVIVYVRRQDDWFQSAYLQWGIRHKTYPGRVKAFTDWYEMWKWRGDYHKVLAEWADWLGHESIRVRVYEAAQMPDGLHRDFLSVLPVGDTAAFTVGGESYQSVNRDLLNLYREYQNLFDEPKDPGTLDRLFQRALVSREHTIDRHRLPFLSPDDRVAIIREFAHSNELVAEEYLGRKQLFLEPYPSPDEPYAPLEQIDTQGLARLAVQLFVYLASELEELKRRNP